MNHTLDLESIRQAQDLNRRILNEVKDGVKSFHEEMKRDYGLCKFKMGLPTDKNFQLSLTLFHFEKTWATSQVPLRIWLGWDREMRFRLERI